MTYGIEVIEAPAYDAPEIMSHIRKLLRFAKPYWRRSLVSLLLLIAAVLGSLPLAGLLAASTLLAVGWLRWPLVWVVLALGPVAMALAWRRLARAEGAG